MDSLEKMLKLLDEEIGFIWEHEDKFRERFLNYKDAFEFYEVSFTSENINYNYILESGQHVTNSKPISVYKQWKEYVLEKE